MRLSVGILAWDSAPYVERLLRAVREFADEVVVGVDSSSTDATEELCLRYADKLSLLEPIGTPERALAWLNEECTGDWILRLDDDELPSVGLIRELPRLIAENEFTHYWLPRRWVIDNKSTEWIARHPWWPDWQLRLFRNVRSLVSYPEHLHGDYAIAGIGGYFSEGSIYHFNLVFHSEHRRRQKLDSYEALSPGQSMPHFYFPDIEAVTTRPPPPDDPPWETTPEANGGLRGLLPWKRPFKSRASARSLALSLPPRVVSLDEMRRLARHECDYGPELFEARLESLDCPKFMSTEQPVPVQLQLRNNSRKTWWPLGLGLPEVSVSYHWLRPSGDIYEFEGLRTPLSCSLQPRESTQLIAQILTPGDPGDYCLQWDLVIEGVSWFSTQGWQGPVDEVRVGPAATDDVAAEEIEKYVRFSREIPGWVRGEAAEALAQASSSLPNGAVIVEVGSFLGSSAVLLAGGRKLRGSGRVHCIDPFDGSGDAFSVPVYADILSAESGRSQRDRFDENLRRAGVEEWVEVHQGTASEIASTWTLPIDLLFLDGDHSRKGARLAYERWSPFLKPGGIIVVHNTAPRPYAEGHDGNRLVAIQEILPPGYTAIRLLDTTTFARKTASQGGEAESSTGRR